MLTLYFMQDGRDFYLYEDKAATKQSITVSIPFNVRDMDIKQAELARTWFLTYCGTMLNANLEEAER